VIDEFLTVTFTYTFTVIKHAGGSGQCLCATLELKDFQGHTQSRTLQSDNISELIGVFLLQSVVNLVRSQVYHKERPPMFAARMP